MYAKWTKQAHLQVKDGRDPIFIKPRQVPFAIRGKDEEEFDRLDKFGIIIKVNNSAWGTVPVVKPDQSVRLCPDYKTKLNKMYWQIPNFQDRGYFCWNERRKVCLHFRHKHSIYIIMSKGHESPLTQTNCTTKGVKG